MYKVRLLIFRIRRRYRFRRICKAVGIKPYPWQRDFVIGFEKMPEDVFRCRQTGKTTAIMLLLLMDDLPASSVLSYDPDWDPSDPFRVRWYTHEYMRLYQLCSASGVRVPAILFNKCVNRRRVDG